MQEDKEGIFDACETVRMCLSVMAPMISGMKAIPENMKKAAQGGFINATDLADYLVVKGLPFRDAYNVSGKVVSYCLVRGCALEDLPLEEYKQFSPLIEEDVHKRLSLKTCVERRNSAGGTSPASVRKQIAYIRCLLQQEQ
jgi:argininosuccinate lyase